MKIAVIKGFIAFCLLIFSNVNGYGQCSSDFVQEKEGEALTIIPGDAVSFKKSIASICADCDYFLDFGDGYSVSGSGPVPVDGLLGEHVYGESYYEGSLTVELTVYSDSCETYSSIGFKYENDTCDLCNSFKPSAGEKYWMSAWVKVDEGQVRTYNPEEHASDDVIVPGELEDAYIEFYFSGPSTSVYFFPTGEIIDGWQRVVGAFDIPIGTNDLQVNLFADEGFDTYFDDIRIHPFNGSMKSYVYDGETFWLTSELDDNNYATFYEYDQEGGLVRIKKETSRGVVTIQETRSGTLIIEE